ncbi:MAG: TIGR00282 family metallophosphoesterase [Candidatus Babeliaceae bacterium]|nr:TIGR00282 family metallophosphoesterase [Candidatus Babeliaceae bacterium]
MRDNCVKILCVGDLMGTPGRAMFKKHIRSLKEKYNIDGIIVNGENTAHDGRGITPAIVDFLKRYGANIITSGNHIFSKRDIYNYLSTHKDLLRPANFPASSPGVGVSTFTVAGVTVGVVNVQGRVFMRELLSCPFKAAESAVMFLKPQTNCIIVDMHAEATSEKMGLAYFLDGQVSCVYGTHTHVQTADERILAAGTAYITDIGMGGAIDSMIGMKRHAIIHNLLTQMPSKFEVELEGPYHMHGIVLSIDTKTGKARTIERFKVIDEYLDLSDPELKEK